MTITQDIKKVKTNIGNRTRYYYLTKCKRCGNELKIPSDRIRKHNGYCKHCVFKEIKIHVKHGDSYTKLYNVWRSMKGRCLYKGNSGYKHYGARGIKVCDEWLDKENGWTNFKKWALENGYKEGLWIERIDVDGNYEPSNCKWATKEEQANNKRNSHFVEYQGEKITIVQLAHKLETNHSKIIYWLNKGMKIEDIIEKIKEEKQC